MSMARPSTISAAPAVTIHPVAAPGPVNARDPELAWMMGFDVIELEDPAPDFVAAATVVEATDGVVVVEPWIVVVETSLVVEASPGETGLVAVVPVPAPVPAIVVGVDESVSVAITGEIGEPPGAEDTIPVDALSFVYGLHVRLRSLPDTTNVSWTIGSRVSVIVSPVAVKGPTVPGVDGRLSAMPVDGIGLGRGALMAISPAETVAGVAPVASTLTTAVPVIAVFPSAAAAEAIDDGMVTCVWKFDALNVWPADTSVGIEAVVVTSFRAMLPTGVPGQYSS
jgi:hypothetical protein